MASCCSHWGESTPYLWPGPVEVAVVEVGERRAHRRRHHRGGDPLADPVRADVLPAPGGRHGQAAPPELTLVDDGDGDAGLLHPGERGGVRLPLERVDVLVPEQRDEQLLGAGDPAREAHQPVRARRQAGAERGEAGRRRRRHARRAGLAAVEQRGQERRDVPVALDQAGTEPVDEEDDVRRRVGQLQVGRCLADRPARARPPPPGRRRRGTGWSTPARRTPPS